MKKEFQSLLSEKKRRELPNILLVSAECAPLSKTGGLADVVGALPRYLQKLDVDARVITPYHR
ncbi:MAG: glycogen/starch synthase [Oscillospiraceae bacterium]|nr:glycogen/starch synthase [Oscillospiraceae bacterium]